ncbi:unnamed protein product [Didymodactylos carnosus]|uniref:Uncharacterized protein n=1 Tax=Didymodactylos carnosus TaxID=1234261 RepID=A0A8S2G6Q2_9BILA|nr:unnamed protein product [Didymodactylos carnosus]CAF4486234.1 unnamed protein product [Didymodactylos carnosus]
MYLFESIFRVQSGLNPFASQTLLERSLNLNSKEKYEDSSSLTNVDVISALLLFCRILPSAAFRYRFILQQASATFNKHVSNDQRRLFQQCQIILRQPYFTF